MVGVQEEEDGQMATEEVEEWDCCDGMSTRNCLAPNPIYGFHRQTPLRFRIADVIQGNSKVRPRRRRRRPRWQPLNNSSSNSNKGNTIPLALAGGRNHHHHHHHIINSSSSRDTQSHIRSRVTTQITATIRTQLCDQVCAGMMVRRVSFS